VVFVTKTTGGDVYRHEQQRGNKTSLAGMFLTKPVGGNDQTSDGEIFFSFLLRQQIPPCLKS